MYTVMHEVTDLKLVGGSSCMHAAAADHSRDIRVIAIDAIMLRGNPAAELLQTCQCLKVKSQLQFLKGHMHIRGSGNFT